MTFEETTQVAAMVRLLWPHSKMDPGTPDVWHPFLAPFDLADVEAAVREIVTAGRDHAPLIGQIVKTLSERAIDAPDWDEAWREIDQLIRRYGYMRTPPTQAFSHPAVAAFARPAWRDLCAGPATGTKEHGTHYAQQREAYQALRTRVHRDLGLGQVGAERGRTDVRRADFAAALGAPAAAQLPEQTVEPQEGTQ